METKKQSGYQKLKAELEAAKQENEDIKKELEALKAEQNLPDQAQRV